MQWHIESDYFALAIFLIMLIKSLSQKTEKTHQEQGFDVVLRCNLLVVVVDIVARLVFAYSQSWWACQISMCVLVAIMPMLGMTWVCYAVGIIAKGDNKWAWRTITLMALPNLAYIFLALTNPLNAWFFTLSPDMQFFPGALYVPLGIGSVMLYAVGGALLTLRYRSRVTPRSHVGVLLTAFAFTAVSVWVQVFVPDLLVMCASSAIVLVFCDATIQEQRRRLLTQELSTAVDEARLANDAKTQFFARMSHDMRTPLNGILGLAGIMQDKVDSPEARDDLDQITLSGEYLLHLVNDTLDISKIESGQMKLHVQATDPMGLASNVLVNAQTLADAGGVILEIRTPDLSTVDHGMIEIDGARLEQVLMNIISNAIKFTPAGSKVCIGFDVGRSAAGEDKVHYRFTISDEGKGMTREFLPHLFDEYSQEERTAKDVQGTGLGMSIVKQLVDLMDGRIRVESEVGRGTTVVMDFDFNRCDAEAPDETEADFSALQGKTALLVEDHPINARIALELLHKQGMETEWSENGEKGVEAFNESEPGHFDVVLMDIRMPVMDGLEAARAIRALDRPDAATVPIIALTANAFDDDIKNTRDAGMNYHLAKPLEPEKLFATIAKLMN